MVKIGQYMSTHWQHRCSSRHSGGFACWALASRTPCLGRWNLRLKAAAKSIASLAWSLASHPCPSCKAGPRWSILTVGPSFNISGHIGYTYHLSILISVYKQYVHKPDTRIERIVILFPERLSVSGILKNHVFWRFFWLLLGGKVKFEVLKVVGSLGTATRFFPCCHGHS